MLGALDTAGVNNLQCYRNVKLDRRFEMALGERERERVSEGGRWGGEGFSLGLSAFRKDPLQ